MSIVTSLIKRLHGHVSDANSKTIRIKFKLKKTGFIAEVNNIHCSPNDNNKIPLFS